MPVRGKHRREARLSAEAPLDVLEKDDPLCRRLDISHRWQQHCRHKCDAPNPQNDRDDVESSGNRYVIHHARSYFHAIKGLFGNLNSPAIRDRGLSIPAVELGQARHRCQLARSIITISGRVTALH